MDYRDRLYEIFGERGPKNLRTIFDCDSKEWHDTTLEKKRFFLEKIISSNYPLEELIEEYKKQYKKTHPHILDVLNKSLGSVFELKELSVPTRDFVDSYLNKVREAPDDPRTSNLENNYPAVKNAEIAIKRLLELIPYNQKFEDIYLKVVAINSLYSTNIYDTYKIARHIHEIKDIDHKLQSKEYSIIDEIAKGHKIPNVLKEKNFYSFATKYCSFHNPDKFAIYDGLIQDLLIQYDKSCIKDFNFMREARLTLNYEKLRNYETFMGAINTFREHFGLENLKLKELDTFLWLYAKDRERTKEMAKLVKSKINA